MQTKTLLFGLFILGLGVIIGGFLGASPSSPFVAREPAGGFHQDVGHMHGGSGAMNGSMMEGMMVESEREFLEGMIPHHQEAVDTSREVLERGGTTEEIRDLARHIIEVQKKEIADMKRWYAEWYGEEYEPTGEYEPMMRELENLSGAELDRVFLTDMIGHHMGAIMMVRSAEPYIEHAEVAELSRGIVSSQSREIMQMQSYLAQIQR